MKVLGALLGFSLGIVFHPFSNVVWGFSGTSNGTPWISNMEDFMKVRPYIVMQRKYINRTKPLIPTTVKIPPK